MLKARKRIWFILICVIAAAGLGFLYIHFSVREPDTIIVGVVLAADQDADKQVPIFNAEIAGIISKHSIVTHSNAAGYFKLVLPSRLHDEPITLTASHAEYLNLELARLNPNRLCILRLARRKGAVNNQPYGGPVLNITNVRLRYTVKAANTFNIGSIVRSFEVQNRGNLSCANAPVCSPDGKWRASVQSLTLDAGDSNQFTNVRSSCVAGPCVFARIDDSNVVNPGRYIHITIRNWSDTVTFLIESEVSRTVESDTVRQAFPATFGSTMQFTLPPTAEGPSIEAELGGTAIIFPLGPNLLLSWATCRQEISPDRTRLFRCELKPSFVFR